MTLPILQSIRCPLSYGMKGVAALLSAWNASLQCIRVLSAALGGLKFMGCKDKIRNLLCTNAGSVRTIGALFLSAHSGHIRIGVDGRGCRTNVGVACFCGFINILRSWGFRVTVSLVCRFPRILWSRFELNTAWLLPDQRPDIALFHRRKIITRCTPWVIDHIVGLDD